MDIVFSFFPFFYIGVLSCIIYSISCNLNPLHKIINVLQSLTFSPLILSLLFYFLTLVFPGNKPFFYHITLIVIILLPMLFVKRHLTTQNVSASMLIKKSDTSLLNIFLLSSIVFIILLTFLRGVLWPLDTSDQVLYQKQAYAYSRLLSNDIFTDIHGGNYKDNQISYSYNSSIRPGITALFGFSYTFVNNIDSGDAFCQFIIFYYFILVLAICFYASFIYFGQNITISLLTLFLITTCYYFINFTIYGFKETALISLILLSIMNIISLRNNSSLLGFVLFSSCLGLMSYIHYSGVIFSFIVFLLYLLLSPRGNLYKLKGTIFIVLLTVLLSGGEIYFFLRWIAEGFRDIKAISTLVDRDNLQLLNGIKNNQEIQNYNVNSLTDFYIKGKLQGLFQIQFFGFIYVTYLAVLILGFKQILLNILTKYYFIFFLLFFLIIIDPLSINSNRYAYVLSISPKYTLVLLPFISIIVSSQFSRAKNVLRKIKLFHYFIIFLLMLLLETLLITPNIDYIYKAFSFVIPLYREEYYYIKLLTLGNSIAIYVSVFFVVGYLLLYLSKKIEMFESYWKEKDLSIIVLLITVYLLPFLFFYNSNYGLLNTLTKSFSSNEVKINIQQNNYK